jgi:hypothetical protein
MKETEGRSYGGWWWGGKKKQVSSLLPPKKKKEKNKGETKKRELKLFDNVKWEKNTYIH